MRFKPVRHWSTPAEPRAQRARLPLLKRILIAATLAITTSTAAAEEAVVRYATANLQTKKTAASERVTQLKKGDKVEVLAREGSWLKVRAGDKEGYLHQNALTGPNGAPIGKAIAGSSGTAAGTSAEAGKGVGESIAWAKSSGRNTAGLDRMVALRKDVSGTDLEQFTTEGNVGPAKK